jgi:hypothetical protein
MNTRLLIAIVFASLTAAGSASAQPADAPRFEVGAQVSALNLSAVDATHAGIGGRFALNLTPWAAIEAEANYFPTDNISLASTNRQLSDITVEYHRRRAEAFFGPKIGQRFQRFGVFGKVRPGFAHLSDQGTLCLGPDCARVNLFNPIYRTSFALDLGGIFEFYPTSRLVARLDLGDTLIRARGTEPPFNGGQTSHNFTSRIGFGVRF